MSYTVRDAVVDLLGYLKPSQRTFPPTGGSVDDPIPQAIDSLNMAAAKLAILGPNWCARLTRSELIHAPTSVTVSGSWAAGDRTVTLTATPDDWMAGCTIRFGTMPFNKVKSISGSVLTLDHPMLTAGSGSGTVYQDCINPASDVMEVLRPVIVADGPELIPAHHPSAFNSIEIVRDYGRGYGLSLEYQRQMGDLRPYASGTNGEPAISDQPRLYFVDQVRLTAASPPVKRIRMAPIPNKAQIIEYRAAVAPTKWTTADAYSSGAPSVDPGTVLPYEDERYVTVFLPFARFYFASKPVMSDSKAREQIVLDFKEANVVENTLSPKGHGLQPAENPEW